MTEEQVQALSQILDRIERKLDELIARSES